MKRRPLVFLLAIALSALLAIAGCGPSEDAAEADETREAAIGGGAPEPAPRPDPGTAQDDPVPLGTPARVGEWEITVAEASLNASEAVAAASEFNNPAGARNQYVMVTIKGTYRGATSGTLWIDLLYSFRTRTGNRYDGTTSFAAPPSPISEAGEVSLDGEVSGSVLFEVPSDQVAEGVLLVEDFMAVEGGGQYYFALE
jgi:hypothetical protein